MPKTIETLAEKVKTIKPSLIRKIGADNFQKLMCWAFEYAYREAEIWGIKRKGKEFVKIAKYRRNFVISEVYECLKVSEFPEIFRVPDNSIIDEMLREEYDNKKEVGLKIEGNTLDYWALPRR